MNCACDVGDLMLSEVKQRLDITWEDPATDAKVKTIIEDGAAYLADKLGKEVDFSEPGDARTLLFEYCRYSRDQALDVFEANYRHLIISAQDKRKVSAFEL